MAYPPHNSYSFEKFIIGLAGTVIIGLGAWMGSSILGLKEEVAAMRSDLKRFDPASVEVKATLKDQSERLDAIEKRLFEIEVGVKKGH